MGVSDFSLAPPDLTCASASQVVVTTSLDTLPPFLSHLRSSPKSRVVVGCSTSLQLGADREHCCNSILFCLLSNILHPISQKRKTSAIPFQLWPVPRQPCAAFSTLPLPLLAYASTLTDARLANSLSDTILLFFPPFVVTTHDINFPSRPSLALVPSITYDYPWSPAAIVAAPRRRTTASSRESHLRRLSCVSTVFLARASQPSQPAASSVGGTGLDHHQLASHGSITITHDQVSLSYRSPQCNQRIETASIEPRYRTTTTKSHRPCSGKSCCATTHLEYDNQYGWVPVFLDL